MKELIENKFKFELKSLNDIKDTAEAVEILEKHINDALNLNKDGSMSEKTLSKFKINKLDLGELAFQYKTTISRLTTQLKSLPNNEKVIELLEYIDEQIKISFINLSKNNNSMMKYLAEHKYGIHSKGSTTIGDIIIQQYSNEDLNDKLVDKIDEASKRTQRLFEEMENEAKKLEQE